MGVAVGLGPVVPEVVPPRVGARGLYSPGWVEWGAAPPNPADPSQATRLSNQRPGPSRRGLTHSSWVLALGPFPRHLSFADPWNLRGFFPSVLRCLLGAFVEELQGSRWRENVLEK